MFEFYERGGRVSFLITRTRALDSVFGKSERSDMTITEFRQSLGLSQEEFAKRLGLKSKAHISEIETANKCSVRVALEIERLSDGAIPASSLNADVGLIEQARGLHTGEDAAA